jgi:hypothetical protein
MAYGDRQGFNESLAQALPGDGAPGGSAGAGVAGGGSLAIPEDPLGALLSGEVEGDSNMPLTTGLSVGAGAGPNQQPDVMLGSRAEKLRVLATESSSSLIRQAARNELRRMSREPI